MSETLGGIALEILKEKYRPVTEAGEQIKNK